VPPRDTSPSTRSDVALVPSLEPDKATPYLDPKHICAYDGPVTGCLCQDKETHAEPATS